MLRAAAVTLLMCTFLAPSAPAQAHEHGLGGDVVIAHDVPADGRTYVGALNHFAVIVKGDDPVPDFHNDIHARVVLNDAVLFETTPDSGHDYDGVNSFDVVFPVPGAYRIEALDVDDDGKLVAMFSGTVHPAPGAMAPQAELVLTASSSAPTGQVLAGQPVHFTIDLTDAAAGGERIEHSDAWFEAWKEGRLEFRAKTHTHDELQELDYAFQEAGTYTVRVTGFLAFPSANAETFAPVVLEQQITVLPGVPLSAVHPESPPMPALGGGVPPINAVVEGTPGGEYLLLGTFDPYTVVGPDTLQHLNALVVDPATGEPVQHVDFSAVLHGASTHLFSSGTLHEYDGILEITTRQLLPGAYTLDVTADRGDWSDTIHMTYLVTPQVVPLNVGPVAFNLRQDAGGAAGETADFVLHGSDQAGQPFAHNEVEFRLFGPGADPATTVPLYAGKLHTHDDGDYGFRLAFPEAGSYLLSFTPTPLMANPVLLTAQEFRIDVVDGPGLPTAPAEAGDAGAGKDAPSLPAALLLAALALAATGRRRRA